MIRSKPRQEKSITSFANGNGKNKRIPNNEADQTTTVVYWTKKITPDKIRKEISLRGFDADEVKADPNGYKQRDGCCKGQE